MNYFVNCVRFLDLKDGRGHTKQENSFTEEHIIQWKKIKMAWLPEIRPQGLHAPHEISFAGPRWLERKCDVRLRVKVCLQPSFNRWIETYSDMRLVQGRVRETFSADRWIMHCLWKAFRTVNWPNPWGKIYSFDNICLKIVFCGEIIPYRNNLRSFGTHWFKVKGSLHWCFYKPVK